MKRSSVGQWESVVVTNIFANGYEGGPQGEQGDYEVALIFGQPVFQIANMDVSFDTDCGDSYIQLHNPNEVSNQVLAAKVTATLPNGNSSDVFLTANSGGRLGKATFPKIAAENRRDAESIAYQSLRPFLGWLSLAYDIPMDINKVVSKELSNGNTIVTFWMSPPVIGIDESFSPPGPLDVHLVECVSQYQEGNNSINDFYRFLCFWKVYEGVEDIRGMIGNQVRGRGLPLNLLKRSNKIPNTTDFPEEVRSKAFSEVRHLYNDIFRNSLAHMDFSRSNMITHNSLADVWRVREAIPVIRHIARSSLQEEIRIYLNLCHMVAEVVQLGTP